MYALQGFLMSFFDDSKSADTPCTSFVHRPAGGIAGFREVFDEASRIAVTAFPMTMVKNLVAAKSAVAACYILADHQRVYIGESGNVGRRLSEHAADPSKAFAREVYVISGGGNASFDKTAALYLQHRLTRAAEAAGLVQVQKGSSATLLDLPGWRCAPLDRIVEDGQRVLYDAGCRAFDSSCASQRPLDSVLSAEAYDGSVEADDLGQMEIGVVATPCGAVEFQFSYGDIWGRGYAANNGFVVMAGSEVRTLINASVNPILHTRRAALDEAGVLADIPGLLDRQRLLVSVWFPSMAIAAKVLAGAHVASSKWAAVRDGRPFVLVA
jgi:hypothetical protein